MDTTTTSWSSAVDEPRETIAREFCSPDAPLPTTAASALALAEAKQNNESVDATGGKADQTFLTPLVTEQLALSTPAPLASHDAHESGSDGDKPDPETAVDEASRNEAEPEIVARAPAKRNRRALFDVVDDTSHDSADCTHNDNSESTSSTACATSHAPDSKVSPSLERLEPQPSTATTASSPDLQQSSGAETTSTDATAPALLLPPSTSIYEQPMPVRRMSSTTTPTNAFDPDAATEEWTLGTRPKRKRSLLSGVANETETSTPRLRGSRAPQSPPRRPSFMRSLSSQSIFIQRTSAATASTLCVVSTHVSVSQQLHLETPPRSREPAAPAAVHTLVLPTIRSKAHPDLNVISPETVRSLTYVPSYVVKLRRSE